MRFQSLTKVHTVRIHVLLMPMLIMSKLKLKLSRVAADSLMDYVNTLVNENWGNVSDTNPHRLYMLKKGGVVFFAASPMPWVLM